MPLSVQQERKSLQAEQLLALWAAAKLVVPRLALALARVLGLVAQVQLLAEGAEAVMWEEVWVAAVVRRW